MKRRTPRCWAPRCWALSCGVLRCAAGILALIGAAVADAHSASDAYLTLTFAAASTPDEVVLHAQWDIALRDLDFVLNLDDDGDGQLTWGEVRHHYEAIEHYAFAHLTFSDAHADCALKPTRRMLDDHADGAYAALFFDVVCTHGARPATLFYQLFFAVDPSHRGILVIRNGSDASTAVLSPQNAKVALSLR